MLYWISFKTVKINLNNGIVYTHGGVGRVVRSIGKPDGTQTRHHAFQGIFSTTRLTFHDGQEISKGKVA